MFNEGFEATEDLSDIFAYLSDDQFNIQVNDIDHHAFKKAIEYTISKDGGKFNFWSNRNIDELTPFKFGEVKDDLIRSVKYMHSEGWHDFNIEIVTYDKIEFFSKHRSGRGYTSTTTSKAFHGNAYHTSIELKLDDFYIHHLDNNYNPLYDTPVGDYRQILCIYVGFGKY